MPRAKCRCPACAQNRSWNASANSTLPSRCRICRSPRTRWHICSGPYRTATSSSRSGPAISAASRTNSRPRCRRPTPAWARSDRELARVKGAFVPGGTPTAEQIAALAIVIGPQLRTDEPMAPKTSMRVGGRASAYAEIRDAGHLVAALSICDAEGIAWTVVGLGSNLIVRDEGFPGLIVRLGGDFTKVSIEGSRVRAGGAVPIVSLCREAAKRGLSGIEGLVGVPGTVGGAVRMNAGTDVEIGDVIDRVE